MARRSPLASLLICLFALASSAAIAASGCGAEDGVSTAASSRGGVGGTGGIGGAGGSVVTTGAGAASSSGMGGMSGSGGATSSSTSASSSTSSSTTSGAGGAGGSGGNGGGNPGAKVVRLLAIGDTGEGNAGQNAVADQMSAKCIAIGGCDAVLVNGDNFYDNGVESVDDPLWKAAFEDPYTRPGLEGVPFYAVLGNHDHGPTSTGNAQAQVDYSSLPLGSGPGMRPSEKWHMPAAWYDVVIGHVHLFGVDTVDFLNGTQKNEMSAKIAASNATWKILFGHHPRYTSGEHFWDNNLLGIAGLWSFQKALYCGVDMFMAGHDHDLEFIDKGRDGDCPNTYFVISGAGSKTRESFELTPTDQGQIFYTEVIEGFSYMEFDANKLYFEFIDRDGKILFTKTMTK